MAVLHHERSSFVINFKKHVPGLLVQKNHATSEDMAAQLVSAKVLNFLPQLGYLLLQYFNAFVFCLAFEVLFLQRFQELCKFFTSGIDESLQPGH